MIEYINSEFFKNSSTDKNLIITRQDGTVYDNDSIYQEQLEINESLCSTDSLQIGACEASSVKFKVRNDNYSWKGEKIKLSLVLDHDTENPFSFGTYIVDSDTPTAEREWREVTAYDALFSILNTDYTNWYMGLWNNNNSMRLKEFRDRFFQNCGVEQEETELINDSVMIYQTVSESDAITGKTILNAICEMNGVFGHINRKGNFEYITLKPSIDESYPSEDLYPSENLYPSEPADIEPIYLDDYTYPLDYEDYTVGNFTELKIQETDSYEGTVVGVAGNRYTINGNFLLFGKPQEELQEIGTNILNTINAIMYRPIKTLNKLCNPCYEVGDKIMVYLRNGTALESYILERTITGIQRLKDSYSSKGTEEQIITGNTLQNQIDQLRGKAKDTDDVIEETQETIEYLREETTVSLDKLDDRIVAEVTRASLAEGNLSSRIKVAEGSIDLEVARATSAEGNLSSRITMTSNSIDLEVTRAKNEEQLLSSRISITESGISSKVSKGDVVSEINQSSDVISLSAGRLIITSGNLTLDRSGNAVFSGTLNGAGGYFNGGITASSGQIGGWLVGENYIHGDSGTFLSTKSDMDNYVWYGNPYQTSIVNGKIVCGYYIGGGQLSPSTSKGYCDLSVAGFFSKDVERKPGYLFAVDVDNGTVSTNTGVFTGSDRRLKKDITRLEDDYAISLIDNLKPSSYRMKEGNRIHSGFIADELKETAEKILGSADDFAAYAKIMLDENEEYGAIRYEELIAPLVKYCQILKSRLDSLESEVIRNDNTK